MRIGIKSAVIALSLCIALATFTGAQQTPLRGITPEDYYSFEFLSDPRISPDGKFVVYVLAKVDRAQNRRLSSIWMVSSDGSRAPWQFTTSPQSSTSPRWSPDGKWLAFLSSRPMGEPMPTPSPSPGAAVPSSEQSRNQIYLLSMTGGEARRLTNFKNGVSTFRWSPDGSRLVLVSRFQEGARWGPRRLSPGKAVLELLANTVSARSKPEQALSTLRQVAATAQVFKGVRGQAKDTAKLILDKIER